MRSSLRSDVSFLRALASSRLGQFLWPEGVIAIVVGIAGGTGLLSSLQVAERRELVRDSLQLIATLLGVSFAAFALVVALFSDEYVILLDKAEGGIRAFLIPFIVAIGWQVSTILIAMTYRAIASDVDSHVEVGIFLTWAFSFVYALADIVALTRNVSMHGLTRANQLRKHPKSDEGP